MDHRTSEWEMGLGRILCWDLSCCFLFLHLLHLALCLGRLTGKSLLLSAFWLGLLAEVGGKEESKVGS